ncbi:hypothetical protein AMATHDRAFT_141942 [Amanita thiersii Skay4041]|uniref:Phospholipid-transporting ATPase n=1 Tax=Amanita thiersii Skay4041 TaxID=703135 RepID=A0A2A9NTQ3_9AGAR|nr:hypothetical protein AMATHDRAFT_141942 [Amanita thiersii Skay4041]
MPFSKPGKRITAWYAKLAAFNVENLFVKKRAPGPQRTVFINEDLPPEYFDKKGRVKPEHVYATNQVITSKYTIVTFVPRNLLEQFRRIANIFFLGIAILQFFNKFSTISPGLVLLPLLIVLAITALKDGYEDVKRHQSDRRVNHTAVRMLSGGDWVNPNAMRIKSKTFVRGINVMRSKRRGKGLKIKGSAPDGDAVESGVAVGNAIEGGEPEIEFDDATVSSVGSGHLPHLFGHHERHTRPHWKKSLWEDVKVGDFVKIMNNEAIPADVLICSTSEDENVAFVETKNLDGETNLKSRNAVPTLTHLRSAADCANKHNSFRMDCDRPDTNMFKLNAAVKVGKEVSPVDMQMVMLRGTVLRNTEWVIGIVMYTGADTKIVLNSGGTPSKRSKVERQMNPQVFINLIILATMAVVCAIVDSVLEHRDYPRNAPWLYGDNQPGDNPSINGLVTFAFALITFQNIVPISLYISIEFVRTCQAAFIYFDSNIYYEKTQQPTLARSWNLSDDLGQTEYIFSDKTGTLTQNSMVFQKCSVGGKVYHGDPPEEQIVLPTPPPPVKDSTDTYVSAEAKDIQEKAQDASTVSSTAACSQSPRPQLELKPEMKTELAAPSPLLAQGIKATNQARVHFKDSVLKKDLCQAAAVTHAETASPEDAARARTLNGFFSVLALCHTVLASVDPETGAIEYKAQSPDEAALVQAAADVGFIFRGRDREILLMQSPFSEEIERYELLNILEFTSSRKRMSVVLRRLNGEDKRMFLLCKGADNVIFERLKENGQDWIKESTEQHLSEFAAEGLRTLTLAYKVINEEEYKSWSERYHEASVALEDREEKVEAVCDELERDLRLLGATAIEDKLQDGVPETIADLKIAGIKVWVATGDKLETAIAIGYSTNLIGRDSNIIVIRGGCEKPVYQQMVNAVEEFFPERDILNEDGIVNDATIMRSGSRMSSEREREYPLQRVNTGISSIVGPNNGDRPGGFVLVIDGVALHDALKNEQYKQLLLRLAIECEGVICCRVSPLQKALIVKLVKDGLGAMTLAIGDGANDVSMIQAADVGVGIAGEEGLQAVNSSDYAIAQFRFLSRLLFVHGHWSYARNGNMILNFFYKNIVCIGVLWWFQIYCAWSSIYVFEYTYLIFWNSFWTIAPVIAIGLFDRIVDDKVLMTYPELYHYGREGHWFGLKWFSIYMMDGVVQSAIIFFLILYTYFSPTSRTDGFDGYLYEFSTTIVFATVIAANLFNGLNTNVWTVWVFFAVSLGIVLLWVYTAIYNTISPGWFVTPVFGNNTFLFHSAYFWLCLPLTVCLALLPRYISKAYKFGFAPDDIDILRYVCKKEPERDITRGANPPSPHPLSGCRPSTSAATALRRASRASSLVSVPGRPSMDLRSASRTDMSTGERSVHRGFDFSTEENGVAMRRMQSNLSERYASQQQQQPKSKFALRKDTLTHMLSVRRGFLKKKPSQDEAH